MSGWKASVAVAVASWGIAAAPLTAQEPTGALYGRVYDPQGNPLPSVLVEVAGPGERFAQATDAAGGFRFLRIDPGLYRLEAGREGWATLEYPGIEIRTGRNTTLELTLHPRIDEMITVDTASPLLDVRKLYQGTRIGELELERIPTARDPWAVLTQVPGVLTDRIQVGGTRGIQANFTTPGTRQRDNDYVLDGVRITDMAGGQGGASPTYYDFDQFEEIQVVTGGTDVTKTTPGVSLNMVTRRGTNQPRGSARYLATDEAFESSPDLDAGIFPPGQGEIETNRLESIENYGVELGGPLVRDRLWGWGSWGRNDVAEVKAGGFSDVTDLEHFAVKLNAQPLAGNSLVASWGHNDKRKPNRLAGPGFAPEATLRQDGPSPIWRLEDSQMVGNSLYVSGKYARHDAGFSLIANACRTAGGCDAAPEALLDSDGVFRGSILSGETERPDEQWALDASYFLAAGGVSHELRFGAGYRDFENVSSFAWPGGRNVFHVAGENSGVAPGPVDFFIANRGDEPPVRQTYTSLWLQDTLSAGHWTASLGLRYDLQQGENLRISFPANPAVPEVLPAVSAPALDSAFEWETLSPRLGVTWASRGERQTLLRASYSRFAAALGTGDVAHDNPARTAEAIFLFFDGDGDNRWSDAATDGEPILVAWSGFDPADPTALVSPNRTDPGLEPPVTDEILLGVERSPRPHVALGLHLTYRRTRDMFEDRKLVRDAAGDVRAARREDYLYETTLEGELPDGRPYSADFYALDPALVFTGGTLLTNGGREVRYRGAVLSLEKRLAGRWMVRGHLHYGKAEWKVPASYLAFDDPTDASPLDFANFAANLGGDFDSDGDLFAETTGRFFGTALQSTWSFNLSGLLRIAPERRWGFDVAANLHGREGYPLPYDVVHRSRIDGQLRFAQATERLDDVRLDDVYLVDLGVQKPLRLPGGIELLLVADLFNALNEGTVLRRTHTINAPRRNFVNETLSPRVWRLGVRLHWN